MAENIRENFVEFNNVTYFYDNAEDEEAGNGGDLPHAAVDSVNFVVKQGEFLGILGRNGSGKSTVAKLINALLLPTEGTVIVESFDTKNDEILWDIRSDVGMVFQNPDNQIIGTSVIEDVAFGPENLGIPRDEMIKRIDAALEVTGLTELKDVEPHLLSGGQKQRVAVAGILAMETKCIVLDEATAMLDPKGRKDVMNVIKKLNKEQGITVIHITHHMDEVVDADYAILIENGKVIHSGKPQELFADAEKMRSAGLDTPQISKLFEALREKGYDVPDVMSQEQALDFFKSVMA
jgi:energy-coupling factor transport system ATP-binding protein